MGDFVVDHWNEAEDGILNRENMKKKLEKQVPSHLKNTWIMLLFDVIHKCYLGLFRLSVYIQCWHDIQHPYTWCR